MSNATTPGVQVTADSGQTAEELVVLTRDEFAYLKQAAAVVERVKAIVREREQEVGEVPDRGSYMFGDAAAFHDIRNALEGRNG